MALLAARFSCLWYWRQRASCINSCICRVYYTW